MGKSYRANFLKIYFWQIASFVLRFFSMFIVTPYLTKEPGIYGIYAVCISVTIFLNYADLGFLRAGQKYAAECYARGDRNEEMRYIGFGSFVLLIFALIIASIFLYLGINPQILIKGLDTPEKISTASSLLLILSAFTPITVIQRMVTIIFGIRLEGYKYQRISLFASVITIISVFYFFSSGRYQIVRFFLFSKTIGLLSVILSLWLAKNNYKYKISELIRCIRFDIEIYKKSNSLAFSGLYIMIVWIVYYELDQMAIAKFLGANKVAIYAIAAACAVFLRTIFGILFGPFTVRVNHFVGQGDDEGLKKYCLQLIVLSAPLVVIPTIAIALVARPFVLSWVGLNYDESVDLVRLLSLMWTLSFISYTVSAFLIAKVRIRDMYIIATIQPLIFWFGILGTFSFLGLKSFALFKLITKVVSEIYYIMLLSKYLKISFSTFFKKVIYPMVIPVAFLITSLFIASIYLPGEKSKVNLLIVLATTGSCISFTFLLQYMTSTDIRKIANELIKPIAVKLGLR